MGEVGDALVAPRVVPGAGDADPQIVMADERNDLGTKPALILFAIIRQNYPDQFSLSTLSSLSQSRRWSGDDAPCPFTPLDHFFVFTSPRSGCRASCGTAMPAEMPAVRVAHHRAVLLEHPSQLELKFGGSGAVARPRRALLVM